MTDDSGHRANRPVFSIFGGLFALGLMFVLAGCAAAEQQSAPAASESSTAELDDLATAIPAPSPKTPVTPIPQVQATESEVINLLMPELRCKDLQAAQDLMQELTGEFFAVYSYDASGDGRAQLIDRNWTVVEQSPAAGMPIGSDPSVGAIKDSEVGTCSLTDLADAAATGASSSAPDAESASNTACIERNDAMLVNANCVDPWPFTVPEATLVCEDGGFSTGVRIDGTTYAINGFASGHRERLGWEDIDDNRYLWLDDGDVLKVPISDAISVAASLCE